MTTNKLISSIGRRLKTFMSRRYTLGAGPAGGDRISVGIYFDYEREFGNILALSTAETGYTFCTKVLRAYACKATWCCVGKVYESYPETLLQLMEDDHELACHTYHHIVPSKCSSPQLQKDIEKFVSCFNSFYPSGMEGFHPPEDGWSLNQIPILRRAGFIYDIAKEPGHHHAHLIDTYRPQGKIIRIPSLFDDWDLASGTLNTEAAYSSWKDKLSKLPDGTSVAIGFHPWVLARDAVSLEAFKLIIEFLVKNDRFSIFRCNDIAHSYRNSL